MSALSPEPSATPRPASPPKMRKALVLFALLWAAPAYADVAYVSDGATFGASTEPITGDISHACASNCIAVITQVCEDNSSTNCVPDGVTVEGAAATLISGASGCVDNGTLWNCVYKYYFVNPPTAADTTYSISTPAGANYQYGHVAFFSGVDQSSPIDDSDKASYTSGTAASITLTTTAAGGMLLSGINIDNATYTLTPAGSETEIEDLGTSDCKIGVEYLAAPTATNYNMTWTSGTAMARSQQGAIALKAASGRRIIT